MGQHATIGNRLTRAPRVKAFDRNAVVSGNEMQYGTDTRFYLDRMNTPAWTTPDVAPYDIASPALGAEFASLMARSIVIQGDWRKPSKGYWTIRTQMGMVKVSKGHVVLGTEYLGQWNMKRMTSRAGRDDLLTAIIAGTLTKA